MNAFEDQGFREAVEATSRKRLIIGGLHTEICLTNATTTAVAPCTSALQNARA